jgi:hypothetical protein
MNIRQSRQKTIEGAGIFDSHGRRQQKGNYIGKRIAMMFVVILQLKRPSKKF